MRDGGAAGAGLFLLRVTLGAIFVMHGYLALAIYTPAGVARLLASLGVPAALQAAGTWYLIIGHLVGGALLVAGLLTRLAALAQVPLMAGAVGLVHLRQGFFVRAEVVDGRASAVGYEFALLVLVAAVTIALAGPGALALDSLRARPGHRAPRRRRED